MYIQTDKNQNIYCAGYKAYTTDWGHDFMPHGIYKITTTGSGITAEAIVSDELAGGDTPFFMDRLGNIIYGNSFGNYYCIKSNGGKFQIETDNVLREPKIYAIPDNTKGGFLCVNYNGELYTLAMNATADGFDKCQLTHQGAIEVPDDEEVPILMRSTRSMQDYTYSKFQGTIYEFLDKLVLLDMVTVGQAPQTRARSNVDIAIVIKSATDVTFSEIASTLYYSYNPTYYRYVFSDGLYWQSGETAQKFDPETGVVSQVYQYTPEAGWEYSSFSFAEGVIMYYATDNANEKRYRFEVRNGNATNEDTAPTTPAQSTPAKKPQAPLDAHEVLDFYKNHSEEINGILRTMRTTNRVKQMFMLGYYIGYSKR